MEFITIYKIIYLVIFYLLIYIVDEALIHYKDIITHDIKARWFLLHAIANTLVVLFVFNDLLDVLYDPLMCLHSTENYYGIALVISLHIYHLHKYKETIDREELKHHCLTVIIIGTIFYMYIDAKLMNYTLFFICGLPGGIDMYLLYLLKIGKIEKLTEKRYNTLLNMCIRMPGILFGCAFGYVSNTYLNPNYNWVLASLLTSGIASNAIYYSHKTHANYSIKKMFN